MNAQPGARSGLAALVLAGIFGAGARGAEPGPQVVTLTTGDRAKLSARYFPGAQGAKSPAVIVLDELGDDARPGTCDEIARQLVKDGCSVLCFDFRGGGRSRGVEPEFWDDANNRQLVKGYKADEVPETIRFADFKPGYLPTLVNDVAAARAYLERRNDGRECNAAQIYVVGFGRGATLGQIWVASEWARYRVAGAQNKIAARPEGRDIAGCVWIDPALALDRHPVPMLDLMRKATAKKSELVGLILADGDDARARFARQCQDALNVKGKAPLVVTSTITDGSTGARGAAAERTGKFVADMRKLQEQPLWENRNFGDRRYVWVFPGTAPVPAKDEGDDDFAPVPLDHLIGKR